MPIIDVRDVSRWYGEVIALSGTTLQLEKGVTGLLGPNGAGKSTLLKILTGQIRANRGVATILGQEVWGNPALFKTLGFCPESDAIYMDMRAQDFLEGMLLLTGIRGAESKNRVRECLEMVGLDPDIRKPMGAFSKGMRQRAKFAQALLHKPQVLLLDEPLNGLDPVGRQHISQLIRQLGREGHTVLISSHILHEIETMTNHVVLLHEGKVMAQGVVHEIRELIEDQALSVHLKCQNVQRLAARLLEMEEVQAIRFSKTPNVVVIETSGAQRFFTKLTKLGLEEDYELEEIIPLDDDLQSVFDYLIR